jgi:hypothetical protein
MAWFAAQRSKVSALITSQEGKSHMADGLNPWLHFVWVLAVIVLPDRFSHCPRADNSHQSSIHPHSRRNLSGLILLVSHPLTGESLSDI